jgi:protein O-mannosyl-transferase
LLAFLLVTAIVLSFAEVRGFAFVNYDDNEYVYDNPPVRAGLTAHGLTWAFTAVHSANWHPLTWLSHMLDSELFGLDAGWHHLSNVALHAAATVVLFGALRALTGSPLRSAFVAALFAVHPLHVESVAWVSERKDVLSALFWAGAMWAWARYARRPAPGPYLLVVLLFVLGLLAKPMVVTLPFALLLLDVWPLGRTPLAKPAGEPVPVATFGALVREKVPLFAISAIASVVTFLAQRAGGAVTTLAALPIPIRFENAIVAYAAYLGKTIWPTGLAAFYPYRMPLPTAEIAIAAVVLVAITLFALRIFRTRPYVLVGWLWYLGTLVPVIGIVRVGDQAMADRFTYLPHLGVFLVLAWGVPDLLSRRPAARRLLVPLAVATVLACVVVTRAQVSHWRDSVTLLEHALAVTERNHLAEMNLSAALLERGEAEAALDHARRAVDLDPADSRVHVNYGVALARMGDPDRARASYERAIGIDPENRMAHLNLALLLSEEERWDESMREYREVLLRDPAHAKAHAGLAWILARVGRRDEAIASYERAIAADSGLLSAYNGLALELEAAGRRDAALDAWKSALAIDPNEFRLRVNLAASLAGMGRLDEAEREYAELLRRKPELVEERIAFADVLLRNGRRDRALAELGTARSAAETGGRNDLVAPIDERIRAARPG